LKYHQITQTLVSKYFIFDYATEYFNKHPKIAAAKDFSLTDAEYQNFIAFLSNKDYNYQTVTEKTLIDLKFDAEKEKKWDEIKSEYEGLKSKISTSKKNDLTEFKPEIKRVLENEIAQRYYYEKGKTEQTFQSDLELKKATETLSNKLLLTAVLKGDGTYKTIGKPGQINAQIDNE
jgi:carboxyl-terminal processing protease